MKTGASGHDAACLWSEADTWPRDVGGVAQSRTVAPDTGSLRIGDAERDRAVAALGDHFAAGRLTREEFDERIDEAMQARFGRDLAPLFADLPSTVSADRPPTSIPGWRAGVRPVPPPLFWLVPFVLVATLIVAVALSAPWLLWGLVWVLMISRFAGRRYSSGPWQHR